ncbi:glycosyltransferase [uncultured Sulfitobacter sp.]|uniref:glycosyltransferase n=1 Tax=uncultured Sulfitobacter sp. TaxID=191468 RepID=UPI002633D21E|nr:glycosyltransferase [uncultured Sulfitobacter sp.]
MIRRLQGLFRRYAAAHQIVEYEGFELLDELGRRIGYLDRLRIAENRAILEGWTTGRDVHMILDGNERRAMPSMTRVDVAEALGLERDRLLGFVVAQHYVEGRCVLGIGMGNGRTYFFEVPMPDEAILDRATRAVRVPFARDLMRAGPHLVKWAVTRNPAARAGVKRALRLSDLPPSISLFDAEILEPDTSAPPKPQEITIVMPVYNALDLLPEVLQRIRDNTDLPWRLVMVEDCSSDTKVRPFLREWVKALPEETQARVTLVENAENLGFIGSVNRGFDEARQHAGHVVLLNSDAFLPKAWATRLLRPILEDADVATVTPMSNDAEICNAPVACVRHDLEPGEVDVIDAFAQTLNPLVARGEAPTGVGFCMAMNARFLKQVPAFDTAFGRGYGEEVDWCQRARAVGGRHEIIGSLFVEHRGGVSFGSKEKLALIQHNSNLISDRYNDYDLEVQQFLQNDPVEGPRMMLGLAWAQGRQDGLMPLYIAHSMGGGAEVDLKRRIKAHIEDGSSVVVVRVGGKARWTVELHAHMGVQGCLLEDDVVLHQVLAPVQGRRVIYSNGVGHHDPMLLPEIILALRNGPSDALEVLVHDYMLVSPAYTLLNSKGIYEGVPPEDTEDPEHHALRFDNTRAPLSLWRAEWAKVLAHADQITAFSQDSASVFSQAYPDFAEHCVIEPHKPDLKALKMPKSKHPKGDPVIGVLGNIGYQKGASVLQAMSADLAQSHAAGLVVIGDIDPTYALSPPAMVHGRYEKTDLPEIVQTYGITKWLIPSIGPETFSFTTHEALATGMPVYCLDLGAQAEAVGAARNGHIITRPADMADLPEAILLAMLSS